MQKCCKEPRHTAQAANISTQDTQPTARHSAEAGARRLPVAAFELRTSS